MAHRILWDPCLMGMHPGVNIKNQTMIGENRYRQMPVRSHTAKEKRNRFSADGEYNH